jgi:hypothetical protein
MKRKIIQIYIISILFLLVSCDPSGNLYLTNGYEYNVMVHSVYEYNNSIIESFDDFYPGSLFAVASKGHDEYSNIIAMRIETTEGTVLAEYTPEYLLQIRNACKKIDRKSESWLFTEKGLFMGRDDIYKRFNGDSEKIMEYYRSDEAAEDLRKLLESIAE